MASATVENIQLGAMSAIDGSGATSDPAIGGGSEMSESEYTMNPSS